MNRLLIHPVTVAHILLIIHLALFLFVTIHPYRVSPPDRSPVMLRGHLVYTSIIRQAKEGAWSVQIPHTTRQSPHVYAHLFFVFLGKIAAIFAIDPPVMYMMARVGAAVLLTWAVCFFAMTVLPKSARTLAVFFVLGLETGPNILTLGKGLLYIQPSIFSYYSQAITYRHFGLPHHTAGEAVGILFLTFFYLLYQKPTTARILAVALTALLGVTILPPYMLVLFMTALSVWGIHALVHHKTREYLTGLTASVPVIAGMALFMKFEFAKGIPWKDFNLVEKTWVTNFDAFINYISSLLLFYPGIIMLALSKIIKVKASNSAMQQLSTMTLPVLLMVGMIAGPLVLLPLTKFPWFPLANFRIMDGYTYFPAGVLAAIGVTNLAARFKTMQQLKNVAIKNISTTILILTILASASLTLLYTRQTIGEQKNIWTNVYPLLDEWNAIAFLNTLPKGSGVMVMNYFGEIIPEYAHVRSFLGSTPAYPDWDERHALGASFYSGTLSDPEARTLLKDNNIDFIFQGSDEKSYLTTREFYPALLTPIFSSPTAAVYKIR